MGNIILTVYNTESKTFCECIENSWMSLSNSALMELHCTWPLVCVCLFAFFFACLDWPLHCIFQMSTSKHFTKIAFSGVRTWCHFKVTNNVYWRHSKGKNCGCKLQEWLYGLSSNGFIELWLSGFEFWRLVALLYMQKHLKECLPSFLTIFKVLRLWVLLLTHLRDYGTWQKFSSWFKCEA